MRYECACVCCSHCVAENLQGVAEYPVQLSRADAASKVIYAAQVHPPSVARQDYFRSHDFPHNLPRIWDLVWGGLTKRAVDPKAVMVVDWGGGMDGDDLLWQEELVTYLKVVPICGTFYGRVSVMSTDVKATDDVPIGNEQQLAIPYLLSSWTGECYASMADAIACHLHLTPHSSRSNSCDD